MSKEEFTNARLFKCGDIVRMVPWNGRTFFDKGCHPECNRWRIMENECSPVGVLLENMTTTPPMQLKVDVPVCFLELVTPADLFVECKSRRVQMLMQPSLYDRIKLRAMKEKRSVNDMMHLLLEHAIDARKELKNEQN